MQKVAILGVGAIAEIYYKNITEVFHEVEVASLMDIIPERAYDAANGYFSDISEGRPFVAVYETLRDVLADDNVDIVLNLTIPEAHYKTTKEALEAGKHVYVEKPFAATPEEAAELAGLAAANGLLLGGAPDTFMGAGIQTVRRLIDSGIIGDIVGADCAMICRGHENWHPDPVFYYKEGGGPMLDIGPYYITALLNLLGEAKGVMSLNRKTFPKRMITSAPKFGQIVDVDIDTHIAGLVEFSSGAIAQVTTTFDVHHTQQARFEIYGTEGTIIAPDPNTFGGPVLLYRPEDTALIENPESSGPYRGYRQMPLMFPYRENSRGIGVADMANAIETGRRHRANEELLAHALEVMHSFGASSASKKYVDIKTKFSRAEPMRNLGTPGVVG